MSYGRTYSRGTERDDSSDIYPTDSRHLRRPGTPGEHPSYSTPDGGTQEPSAAPSAIGAPLPIVAELDDIVEQFRGR